jgi:sulfite exporter TauE/SafE
MRAKNCHCEQPVSESKGLRHYAEIGGILLLVLALYEFLRGTHILSFSTELEGVVSIGAVFVVGLVAAGSTCLAVVGGLLLSVSASWAQAHQARTTWEKFEPLLLFNMGRLAGYFVLGGLVGLLGSSIALSSRATGYATVAVAVVMIVLGLNILKILPKRYCTIPLPRALKKRIQNLSHSRNPAMPALLGSLTFFLPCGFTQSMQLLALGSGSFLGGATIMFVFALGTLPALIGLSAVSSVAQGNFARYFFKFSGAFVLLLGLYNLQSGLLLSGIDAHNTLGRAIGWNTVAAEKDPHVMINERGQQIISVTVSDQGYSPSSVTIDPGMETWIYAFAPNGVSGCASFMTVPALNRSTPIQKGGNWLYLEHPTQSLVATCSMGMLRLDVNVRNS